MTQNEGLLESKISILVQHVETIRESVSTITPPSSSLRNQMLHSSSSHLAFCVIRKIRAAESCSFQLDLNLSRAWRGTGAVLLSAYTQNDRRRSKQSPVSLCLTKGKASLSRAPHIELVSRDAKQLTASQPHTHQFDVACAMQNSTKIFLGRNGSGHRRTN